MKLMRYAAFSERAHRASAASSRPALCQFELTYRCQLDCVHCYCACYRTPQQLCKELSTQQVFGLLRRIRASGCLWLCLTGGDPLARPDFAEVYAYARRLGFLVCVFTSGCPLSAEVLSLFREQPPFNVEVTLYGSRAASYEKVSRAEGSFARAVSAIDALIQAGIPLKLKTHLLRENLGDLPGLRAFARKRRKRLHLSFDTNPRVNGDLLPLAHRLAARTCRRFAAVPGTRPDCGQGRAGVYRGVFPCAIAGQSGVYVDARGRMVPCSLIRRPAVDLSRVTVAAARRRIIAWVKGVEAQSSGACSRCASRDLCIVCPGRSLLETGRICRPVPFYCSLAGKRGYEH